MKNKKISLVLLFIFIIEAILVKTGFFNSIDIFVYGLIKYLMSVRVTKLLIIVTNLVTVLSYIVAIGCLVVFLRKREKSFRNITLNISIAVVFYSLLKFLFNRPRPDILWLIEAKGNSFPSGHSYMAMFLYGLIVLYVCKYIHGKKKVIINTLLILLIIITGLSRIYLGVHFFSDVLGGFILGLSHLLFVKQYILEENQKYFFKLL